MNRGFQTGDSIEYRQTELSAACQSFYGRISQTTWKPVSDQFWPVDQGLWTSGLDIALVSHTLSEN